MQIVLARDILFCSGSTSFTCNSFWDKVEASVKITASAITVLGNGLVLIITINDWDYSRRFRKLVGYLALADLLFAKVEIITGIPLFWICKWVLGKSFCNISKGIINVGGIFALSLVTIIALDRQSGNCKTIQSKSISTTTLFLDLLSLSFFSRIRSSSSCRFQCKRKWSLSRELATKIKPTVNLLVIFINWHIYDTYDLYFLF